MRTSNLTPNAKKMYYKMRLRSNFNTIKNYYLKQGDPVFPPTEKEKEEAEQEIGIIVRHLAQLKEFSF